jgi:hypothetical protein
MMAIAHHHHHHHHWMTNHTDASAPSSPQPLGGVGGRQGLESCACKRELVRAAATQKRMPRRDQRLLGRGKFVFPPISSFIFTYHNS